MAENDADILKEFMEFMDAKKASESNDEQDNREVEVWDKEGNGARVRWGDAKPFLQKLGIGLDPEPKKDDDNSDDKTPKGGKKPAAKTPPKGQQAQSVARKFFGAQSN